MQNFLIPVDFSPASKNAASYAAQLAKVIGARLLLFHAYMLPTPVSEVPYVMVTADEMQKENEELVRKEAEFLTKQYGVEVEWLVRIGIASDEVKALTKERNSDMIVMGMKGAGEIEKIIGSTTTNVIRKVRKPVLIVPHDTSYKRISMVTYASDFSYKTSHRLFDPLIAIVKQFQANLIILNVQLQHAGAKPEELVGKKDIEEIFKNVSHQFVSTEDQSVNTGINHYIQRNSSDLLVMVSHAHGFLERIFSKDHTTAMAYETHIPMLVLQDKD